MKPFFFHTVNTGLFFYDGQYGLLIDGIHTGLELGFSNTPKEVINSLLHLNKAKSIHIDFAFTHMHPDHFDKTLLEKLCVQMPHAKSYIPSAQPITNPTNFTIIPFATIHDGKPYQQVPHTSLLLSCCSKWFFIAGDAILTPELAEKVIATQPQSIDTIFINFYQLNSSLGQAFLRALNPKEIFLYHLPFEEDDRYRFHRLVRHAIERHYDGFVQPKWLPHMNKKEL